MLALDVYEHAYYVDYQNRKEEYISWFMEHIDWEWVGQRYRLAIQTNPPDMLSSTLSI